MEKRTAWIVGLSVAALAFFGPTTMQLVWMSWKRRVLVRQMRDLERLHQTLVAEQQRLQSDPVYVEGLIRSTFKVAKPGELVVPLDSSDEPDHAR